ncbi:MAG: motility associated factor glycosyltransferase family protein [Epsilonproteobacteria bacterium]|nr:motility associated factor glycosyltransferase family protein [Campylobacterota bacterium]
MNIYEKNLKALAQADPTLSARLFAIESNRRFEVFVDPKDPVNVNLYDREKEYIFYAGKPVEEITKQYEEMVKQFARHPFMWIFGVANGLLVKMLLNLGKTLFVMEPETELLYVALNLLDFSKEIEEGRLKLFISQNINFHTVNDLCSGGDIKVFLKTYSLETAHEYYPKFHIDEMVRVNKLFTDGIRTIITKEGNDANDSLIGLNHQLKHIPAMLASYPLQRLKKKRNTDYAVIVSTGPSLAKQLPLLKKYQNHITILCIDASLPILQKEGIAPDFVFSLERVEPTAKFYENLDRELLKETIFMPTSIVHPKTLENIGNMRKAITMRPFGYNAAFQLSDWGYIGLGMSAANMAFDFAYVCQYPHIALIGQDLAFAPDGKTHSKGAVYGEKEEQYEKETMMIPGYYGDEVKTSKWWYMFLTTFIRDIPKVKEDGMQVYNCTEGGAYIEGAEHIPFQSFLDKTDTSVSKRPVSCEPVSPKRQTHLLRRSKRLIELYIQRLGWIKSETEKVFLNVMEKIETLENLNRDKELEKIDFDELAAVISQIDKIKDIYEEDRAMKKFTNITNPFIVNAELELARIMVRPSDTEIEKKVKMIDWIYEHKSWLFFLAGALENIIHILQTNYDEIYKDL